MSTSRGCPAKEPTTTKRISRDECPTTLMRNMLRIRSSTWRTIPSNRRMSSKLKSTMMSRTFPSSPFRCRIRSSKDFPLLTWILASLWRRLMGEFRRWSKKPCIGVWNSKIKSNQKNMSLWCGDSPFGAPMSWENPRNSSSKTTSIWRPPIWTSKLKILLRILASKRSVASTWFRKPFSKKLKNVLWNLKSFRGVKWSNRSKCSSTRPKCSPWQYKMNN